MLQTVSQTRNEDMVFKSSYTKVIKVANNAATPANVTTTLPNRVPVPLGSEKSPIVLIRSPSE
jgi:hypothetical protein